MPCVEVVRCFSLFLIPGKLSQIEIIIHIGPFLPHVQHLTPNPLAYPFLGLSTLYLSNYLFIYLFISNVYTG